MTRAWTSSTLPSASTTTTRSRLGCGDRSKAAAIRSWKTGALALEAVGGRAARRAPRPRSTARADGDPQQDVRSGMQPATAAALSVGDQIRVEPAGAALVGDGRVDEAVADDVAAGLERRAR